MVMCEIIKKGPIFLVKTKHGDREKRFFTVKEESTGKQYDASMFISSSTPNVAPGDSCLMDIVVSGEYTNIKKIETVDGNVGEEKEEPKKEEPKKEDPKKEEKKEDPISNGMTREGWEKKETRNFRGKAIMYALETLKHTDWATENMPSSEVENLVMMSADNYLTYIYDGQKPLVEDEPLTK